MNRTNFQASNDHVNWPFIFGLALNTWVVMIFVKVYSF